jgi:hypothetical protein
MVERKTSRHQPSSASTTTRSSIDVTNYRTLSGKDWKRRSKYKTKQQMSWKSPEQERKVGLYMNPRHYKDADIMLTLKQAVTCPLRA